MIYSWFTLYVFNHIVLILKLFIFIICFKISKKVMYVWFQFYNKSNYANGSNSIKCVHQLFVHYTIYIQFMTSPFDPVMHDFFLKGRLPNPEILIYYTVTQLHCVQYTVLCTVYCRVQVQSVPPDPGMNGGGGGPFYLSVNKSNTP